MSGEHVVGENTDFDLNLDHDSYPKFCPITYFLPAGKLCNQEKGTDLAEVRLAFIDMGVAFQKLSGPTTTRHVADNGPLALTLAKIAYCYAVARLGLDAFDGSEIRALLLEERSDVYNFVGGIAAPPPWVSDIAKLAVPIPLNATYNLWTSVTPPLRPAIPLIGAKRPPHIHELHLRKEGNLQITQVHLFASCRVLPPYEIVVGKSQ